MKITREFKGSTLTFKLEGRLDTMTAPELEAEIDKPVAGSSQPMASRLISSRASALPQRFLSLSVSLAHNAV